MGSSVLRGISTALLVTVLTLFAGTVWGAVGLGGLTVSNLVDIGLLASCLVGGYRTGKESGHWLMGGVTGAGYVSLGTILLALFLPIQGWGFIQVLTEGTLIGLVAGTVGAKGMKGAKGIKGAVSGAWQGRRDQMDFSSSYGNDDNEKYDDLVSPKPDLATSNWMERPEEEIQGSRIVKWDTDESSDIEWPWDREEDQKLIASESSCSEPLAVWEKERVNTEAVGWNRTNLDNGNMNVNVHRDSRPWWEE